MDFLPLQSVYQKEWGDAVPVALLIPCRVHGKGPFYFQVDTGLDRTLIYEEALKRIELKKDRIKKRVQGRYSGKILLPSLEMGTYSLAHLSCGIYRSERFNSSGRETPAPTVPFPRSQSYRGEKRESSRFEISAKQEYPILGALGMDVLEHFHFGLDFTKGRFYFVPLKECSHPWTGKYLSKVPFQYGKDKKIAFSASWTQVPMRSRASDQSGVSIRQGGFSTRSQTLNLFYDSGASPLTVLVRNALWFALTGKDFSDRTVQHFQDYHWGEKVYLFRAPVSASLHLGSKKFCLQKNPFLFTSLALDQDQIRDLWDELPRRRNIPNKNKFSIPGSPSPQPSPQEGEGDHRKPKAFGYTATGLGAFSTSTGRGKLRQRVSAYDGLLGNEVWRRLRLALFFDMKNRWMYIREKGSVDSG